MSLEEEGADDARDRVLGRLLGITTTFGCGAGLPRLPRIERGTADAAGAGAFILGRGTDPVAGAGVLILGRGTVEAAGAGVLILGRCTDEAA